MAINNLNMTINSARGRLSRGRIYSTFNQKILRTKKIINYYEAFAKTKNTKNFIFDLTTSKCNEIEKLKLGLVNSFSTMSDKEFIKNNPELIRECFEIGCYILYDRQILDEVIEKQKKYETDYVADFLKYVLRIFFKRYDNKYILTKNQREDIRVLCLKLLGVNSYYEECSLIYKISAKDIVEILRDIAI